MNLLRAEADRLQRQQARYHAGKVRELVARRSPDQVASMEIAKGLR